MSADTTISLIGDGRNLDQRVWRIISNHFRVTVRTMDRIVERKRLGEGLHIFCLSDLRRHMLVLDQPLTVSPGRSLFILANPEQEDIAIAREVGALGVLSQFAGEDEIVATVRRAANRFVERAWSEMAPEEEAALRASLASFDGLMSAGGAGEPLPLDEVFGACEKIQDALGVSNVNRWLGALAAHHDNTYRHSMYVCGALAFFARAIGIQGQELKELTVGGFLHDAGKSKIPLAILDKPGKLDDGEWAVMKEHPEHSREILLKEHGLNERVVSMAVHHHERLDGEGYPDRLPAADLDDPTRLTAIADVYAALTEERAYKRAMAPDDALDLMATMKGHLDMDFVRVFRDFMMDQRAGRAADAVAAE